MYDRGSGARFGGPHGIAGGAQSIGNGNRAPGIGPGRAPRLNATKPGSIPFRATLDAEPARAKIVRANAPPSAPRTAGSLTKAACCGVSRSVTPGSAGVVDGTRPKLLAPMLVKPVS